MGASGDVIADPADDLSDVTSVRFTLAVDHFTVFGITAVTDGVAPAVPGNVSAAASSTGITITWDAVTTNADASSITDLLGYEVYRDSSSTGTFSTQINVSDIVTTSYIDTSASPGGTYYYKVTAADSGGLESTKSSTVSAMRPSNGGGGGGGSSVPASSEPDFPIVPSVPTSTVVDESAPEPVLISAPNSESDSLLGITLDEEGRRVAALTSGTGTSPVSGTQENISQLTPGQFVRSYSFSTVYYVTDNLQRRPFWDGAAFFTWANSWDDVVWVTDATLSTMTLEEPMLPKPGSVLVKIQSDPKVYLIESNVQDPSKYLLRWVTTEEIAQGMYGTNWSSYVLDLAPTVFGRYAMGNSVVEIESIDTANMMTRVLLLSK